jgi:hypothetical protein
MDTHLDIDEINPHLGLLRSESHVSDSERDWFRWLRKVEQKLGHSIDGNQATDGYSLDYANDYWVNCDSPDVYVADVRVAKAELDAAFGPVVR